MADPTPPAIDPNSLAPTIFEAIVKKRALAATYNRAEVTLAPHILYTRHGELHLDAVTLDRDGRPPKELKLGTFKVLGLGRVRVTARGFSPSELFEIASPRYDGTTLMAIEPD